MYDDLIDNFDMCCGCFVVYWVLEGFYCFVGWFGDFEVFGCVVVVFFGDLFVVWSDDLLEFVFDGYLYVWVVWLEYVWMCWDVMMG